MKNLNRFILIGVLQILCVNIGSAQNWMCDIKPGAKLFQTSFYRSDYTEKLNNTGIQFDYSKKH